MSDLTPKLEWLLTSAREADKEGRTLKLDPGYVLEAMETLATAQARIAELEDWQGVGADVRAAAAARVWPLAELEAAQRPPLGYAVTSVHILDGSRCVHANPILDRAAAQEHARAYASARVVELREVQP